MSIICREVVPPVYVRDRIAIGNHKTFELPVLAKMFLEQHVICTRRLSIDRVIRAHDGSCMSLCDRNTKSRKISVLQVVIRHLGIEVMSILFRTAVYGEVFGCRDKLQILRIVAL